MYGKKTSQSGSQANEFDFAGQQTDASTNLQYLRARYYDTNTGIFMSRDPMAGNPGWLASHFGYAGGSPVSFADPTGLCRVRWACSKPLPWSVMQNLGNAAKEGAVAAGNATADAAVNIAEEIADGQRANSAAERGLSDLIEDAVVTAVEEVVEAYEDTAQSQIDGSCGGQPECYPSALPEAGLATYDECTTDVWGQRLCNAAIAVAFAVALLPVGLPTGAAIGVGAAAGIATDWALDAAPPPPSSSPATRPPDDEFFQGEFF